jgi:signal recognition particle GTPase
MFDKLTERLSLAVEQIRGRGRLTEENIADTLRQVRMALLEADVAVPVVKQFVDAVKAARSARRSRRASRRDRCSSRSCTRSWSRRWASRRAA